MESLILSEEWMLSNVLSSTDLYQDELLSYNTDSGVGEFLKSSLHLTDHLKSLSDDSGIIDDFDSWLDENTCITNLDASLQTSPFVDVSLQPSALPEATLEDPVADVLAELEAAMTQSLDNPTDGYEAQTEFLMQEPLKLSFSQLEEVPLTPIEAPSSPMELSSLRPKFPVGKPVVKYVQPSTIDISSLSTHAQIVMDDLNVLHLPELPADDQAAILLLEALADPRVRSQLNVTEVESLLSSPPSSPEALVPGSPVQDSDDEYVPSRKRKSTAEASNPRSLKALKPSEKKERKKVQNKNAATKYRLKKRAEGQIGHQEMNQLEEKNTTLKHQVEDLDSEIKYMKGLLNEVLKGKGLRIQ